MLRFLAILSLIFANFMVDSTTITAKQNFICYPQSNWQVAVEFYKLSSRPREDLYQTGPQEANGTSTQLLESVFEVTSQYSHLSRQHDIYMTITHTCTNRGNRISYGELLGRFDGSQAEFTVVKDYLLGDR